MNRITLSILLLFMLVLGIYVPSWVSDEAAQKTPSVDESLRPNYQAHNMRSTFYNAEGELNHLVYAKKMEHYQLLGFTLFETPQYTIFVENQAEPWQLDAEEGTLYENEIIRLEHEVEIRTLSNKGYVQTIKTEFLEVNLKDRTMMSDQPVEITGQNFVIKSKGFTANLETQQYELKDHVQTVYAPY
ncbi:LPS export ABC transporter periplasmic protein LptC [Aestuariibacter sp. AA17]|uniref:Lipopolysaccharide export system protein LptC n=1 Tax=Fluctibacter corallii TaxID=2984329 RepID=A0ABT3A5W4_9ALTE|nr:LPS export ABC transporter periplasmic protein LptC [Aestuariibacter sp. AA17]MCV2883657.1 LPS export ABC transporter periplasmic protein LptC [Aestuariibacter sp. AA17]